MNVCRRTASPPFLSSPLVFSVRVSVAPTISSSLLCAGDGYCDQENNNEICGKLCSVVVVDQRSKCLLSKTQSSCNNLWVTSRGCAYRLLQTHRAMMMMVDISHASEHQPLESARHRTRLSTGDSVDTAVSVPTSVTLDFASFFAAHTWLIHSIGRCRSLLELRVIMCGTRCGGGLCYPFSVFCFM